jgi:uncharacterized DUF497 family protein
MDGFEWDETKRKSNLEKHKLDFVLATKVFDDPRRLNLVVDAHGELRTITIGAIAEGFILVICVVWTDRKNKKRIISARRASQNERQRYEG